MKRTAVLLGVWLCMAVVGTSAIRRNLMRNRAVDEGSNDYSRVAEEAEAHPEPVPPPHPQVTHHFQPAAAPKPAASAPTAAAAAVPEAPRFSQTATSASASATIQSAVAVAGEAVKKVEAHAGTFEALKRYQEFLQRNSGYSKQLQSLFEQFDLNHDRKIDIAMELPVLVQTGVIVKPHANVIASWDLNHDKAIDQQEFMMGPLYVQLLQYHPDRQAEFDRLVNSDADTSAFTEMFVRMAAGSADDLPQFGAMRFKARDPAGKTEEQMSMEEALELARKEEEETLAHDDTARFAQKHGRRRRKNANAAARAAELIAQKRPKSRHGVPSEADETCVICQFLVQRIQKQLYFTLANQNDGFPADPNSEVPAKKMRQVNSQLLNRRGGKGMLRILAEDLLSDMCSADTMPELYYPICRSIDKVFPVLLDAIYFQFHSEAVCEEAKLCGARTYFNRDSSVHLPSKSVVFNSARGKCGMMGGARERPDDIFSSAVCFGGLLLEKAASVH